jgi:hypothetical protein
MVQHYEEAGKTRCEQCHIVYGADFAQCPGCYVAKWVKENAQNNSRPIDIETTKSGSSPHSFVIENHPGGSSTMVMNGSVFHFAANNNISYVGSGNRVRINGREFNGNVLAKKDGADEMTINGKCFVFKDEANVRIEIYGNAGSVKTVAASVEISGDVNGSVTTTSGDVKCGRATHSVKTTSGNVTVQGSIGGSVSTMSGDVGASTIQGNCSTMSGDISGSNRKRK